jgi:hypothetical protein
MIFVATRLGENFDAPEPQLVELRRERILINADLANRVFRRQLAAAEAVDENRSSARPGRRAGERLKIRREILGIVRKRVEIAAAKHQSARVACRIGRNLRSAGFLHRHLLRGRHDLQL